MRLLKRAAAVIAIAVASLGIAAPVNAGLLDPVDASTDGNDRLCITLHLGRLGSPRSCAPML
jgi:hypothetical protein